jgi:VCBS repeat-containing protein
MIRDFLTVSPTAILDGTETTDSLTWDFDSGSEAFDFLAEGETLVLTYTVSATDDGGTPLSDTETVTITITGTNDGPDVFVGVGDSAAETLTETNTTLTATDTLSVSDADLTDVVTSSVTTVTPSGTTAGLGSDNAALLAMMTSTANVLDGTELTDTLTWAFNSGSESFDYLAAGESLTLTYTITVTDSEGAADTQTVVVTINGTSDAPVITDGPDTVGLTETDLGLNGSGSLTVTDLDRSDIVTAAVDGVAVTGTGASSVPGTMTNTTLESFLSVSPTAILDGSETTATLIWDFDSGSEAFDFLAAGETLVLTYTVSATDDDGTPLSDTETVTVTITGTNDAPVISDGPDSSNLTETDAGLTDSGSLTVGDRDLTDNVTAAVDSLAVGGTGLGSVPAGLTNATLLSYLSVSPAAILDGSQTSDTLTWSFDSGSEAFDFLADSETLVLTYTISATDDDGSPLSDTESVTITITGTNDAPVSTSDVASGSEDTTVQIDLSGTDIDGTVENFVINNLPANGTLFTDVGLTNPVSTGVDYAASGESLTLYFVPDVHWNGATSFDFVAKDDLGLISSTSGTIDITIEAINDDPTESSGGVGSVTTTEDVSSPLDLSVLNFEDVDGSSGSFTLTISTSNGGNLVAAADPSVSIGNNGSSSITLSGTLADLNSYLDNTTNLEYLHSVANQNGTAVDSISVELNDNGNTGLGGGLNVLLDTFDVNITADNDDPVADDDGFTIDEDAALNGNVQLNDSDIDLDPLTATLVLGPSNAASFVLNSDGSFSYVPEANFNGADSFEYRIDDGNGGFDTAIVSITINALNDAPITQTDQYLLLPGETDSSLSVLANDFDVEGDSIVAILLSGPANGVLTLSADGNFVYVPNAGFTGLDSFTYLASDGVDTSAATIVEVRIAGVAPPVDPGPGPTDPNPNPEPETNPSEPETPENEETSDDESNDEQNSVVASVLPPTVPVVDLTEEASERSAADLGDFLNAALDKREAKAVLRAIALNLNGDDLAGKGSLDELDEFRKMQGLIATHNANMLWDELEEEVSSTVFDDIQMTVGAVTSVGALGYLLWTLRGGALMAVALAQLPSWRMIDPLPVLESYTAARHGNEDEFGDFFSS